MNKYAHHANRHGALDTMQGTPSGSREIMQSIQRANGDAGFGAIVLEGLTSLMDPPQIPASTGLWKGLTYALSLPLQKVSSPNPVPHRHPSSPADPWSLPLLFLPKSRHSGSYRVR